MPQLGHNLVSYQLLLLGHDLELSMPQLGHNLVSYQWLLLGHDLQLIPLEQGHNYSLTVIKAESLYQLMYLRFICYKLKLIDLITISTSSSLSHD